MSPRRRTIKAKHDASTELGRAAHSCRAVRRRRPAGADWKQRARGIYAQPLATRDTLNKCLDDPKRNWGLAEIAALVLKKHRYKMSLQAVSDYRRKRLAAPVPMAAAIGEIVLQMDAPAGTRFKIVPAR